MAARVLVPFLCLLTCFSLTIANVSSGASGSSTPSSRLSWFMQQLDSPKCNSLNPKCNITAAEAQIRHLSSYKELVTTLQHIAARAKLPIAVGPLVKNAGNGGLVDIDVPLDTSLAPVVKVDVCGEETIPTIREAVVCTVSKGTDPMRGNTDAELIGSSNQRRALWGARLGNKNGTRVFIVTQLHGNEAASTEAALRLLHMITRQKKFARPILKTLDILFLVRANVDGGEPSAPNAPQLGVPFTETWGFFRHNVDPTAGGGFQAPTEPDFFGVVGRGYDLNRYNYAGLDSPIRPVESQAIVAVLHAFRPDIVFDMHGDQPKVFCELDPATVMPGAVQGLLPTVQCKPPADPVPTILTQRESMVIGGFFAADASILSSKKTESLKAGSLYTRNTRLVRSIAAEVMRKVGPRVIGRFSRFSQIELEGKDELSDGTVDRAALALSAVGSGWEVSNFGVALSAAVVGVAFVDGAPEPNISFDRYLVEACFLKDNICIHEMILRETITATRKFTMQPVVGDNGFCAIPLDNGVVVSLPTSAGWPQGAIDEPVMIPQGGAFGVPGSISGRCAGDP